ncbi:coiled-coil domain-containing protein 178-like [Protopterus annectens]|uniref:coiled-coil domain-containing protein 178-like n=1 Tax=Protopterus annectens TaxID=7888 RepID=UPI001CFB9BB0|nr:coiled-coil domain-containing protein 178-like [Protopterus annectens]
MPDIQLLNFACKNETEQEGTETVKFQAECPAVADDGGSVAFPAAKEQNAFIREGGKVHLVHSTRRRSCSLVNTPSPCINKALFHIQELEVKLEDWYQKDDCIDFSLSPGEVWKEMSLRVLMTGDHSQTTSRTTDMLSTNLYIEGVSLSAKENNENLDLRQITKIVLNEITELISRLEADRQEAEKALNLEKQRREALLKKIDKLSLWKLQQLPAAVQKEHEACARDINELQWHIRNKRRQLKQMQDQTAKAELLNERLLEDIDFVKKHSPLVEEKVELEHHALDELKLAQDQALTVLVKANEELKEAQLLSDDASNKAATERRVMRAELDDAENNLKQLQNDFNHSETVWDTYCSRITENENKLKQTEEVYMKLQQEEATLKLERNNLIEKVISTVLGHVRFVLLLLT